jgi:hypothetical protein
MQTKARVLSFTLVRCGFLLAGVFAMLSVCCLRAADKATNAATAASEQKREKGGETPEKLISQIAAYCLAGDSTNLLNCFDTSTKIHDLGAKSFAVSIELAKAKVNLREALVRKFGVETVDSVGGTYIFPPGTNPLKKVSDAFDKPKIAVNGDTAAVTFGSNAEVPLKLERKNNRWFMVRELDGMAAADEQEATDTMEANRYYMLGVRDALKVVPEAKTMEEADKKISEAVNRRVGEYLTRPAPPEPSTNK